jgi:hypothetical protein
MRLQKSYIFVVDDIIICNWLGSSASGSAVHWRAGCDLSSPLSFQSSASGTSYFRNAALIVVFDSPAEKIFKKGNSDTSSVLNKRNVSLLMRVKETIV